MSRALRLQPVVSRRPFAALLFAAGIACGTTGAGCGSEPSAVRPRQGPTPEEAARAAHLHVYPGVPERPYAVVGPVEVRCPAGESATAEGQGSYVEIESETVGGCSFEEVVGGARVVALRLRADGVFGIQTHVARNGKIVLLLATAFRYAQAAAPPQPASPGAAPAPTIEQRLEHLKALRERGLITPEDYERRRAEILKEL